MPHLAHPRSYLQNRRFLRRSTRLIGSVHRWIIEHPSTSLPPMRMNLLVRLRPLGMKRIYVLRVSLVSPFYYLKCYYQTVETSVIHLVANWQSSLMEFRYFER